MEVKILSMTELHFAVKSDTWLPEILAICSIKQMSLDKGFHSVCLFFFSFFLFLPIVYNTTLLVRSLVVYWYVAHF